MTFVSDLFITEWGWGGLFNATSSKSVYTSVSRRGRQQVPCGLPAVVYTRGRLALLVDSERARPRGNTGHGVPVLGLPKLPGRPGPGSLKPAAAGSCPTVSEDPLFLPASLPYSRNHSETSLPKKTGDQIPGKSIWQQEG